MTSPRSHQEAVERVRLEANDPRLGDNALVAVADLRTLLAENARLSAALGEAREAFFQASKPVAVEINRAVSRGPDAAVRLTQFQAMAIIAAVNRRPNTGEQNS